MSKVVFGNGKLHRGTRFFEIEILDQFKVDEREVMREGLTIGVTAWKPMVAEGQNPHKNIPEFADQINDLTWLIGFDGQYFDCLEEDSPFYATRWNPSSLRIGDVVSIFITRTNYFELIVNDICVFQSPMPLINY